MNKLVIVFSQTDVMPHPKRRQSKEQRNELIKNTYAEIRSKPAIN
jgi:hypothetical protein